MFTLDCAAIISHKFGHYGQSSVAKAHAYICPIFTSIILQLLNCTTYVILPYIIDYKSSRPPKLWVKKVVKNLKLDYKSRVKNNQSAVDVDEQSWQISSMFSSHCDVSVVKFVNWY